MESYVSVRSKEVVLKDHMDTIMNKENDWGHNVEENAEEGRVVCVSREEGLQA